MNYKVTDWLFDQVMPNTKPNTYKVICFVARKTAGWEKEWDVVSWSQFLEGTGIVGRRTLNDAIQDAIDGGYIVREELPNGHKYKLLTSTETVLVETELVPKRYRNQYRNGTGTSTETVHTNYKNNKNNKEREEGRKQPEKSPPHREGFLASTSADRPYDLEAALKSIAINSNGKISTAAKDLQRMGIKPEQLVGFKKYWAENHSKMGAKPWPVQVVDLWDDYQGWSGKNAATVNAAPDLTSLPSYRFMEATND